MQHLAYFVSMSSRHTRVAIGRWKEANEIYYTSTVLQGFFHFECYARFFPLDKVWLAFLACLALGFINNNALSLDTASPLPSLRIRERERERENAEAELRTKTF